MIHKFRIGDILYMFGLKSKFPSLSYGVEVIGIGTDWYDINLQMSDHKHSRGRIMHRIIRMGRTETEKTYKCIRVDMDELLNEILN